MPNNKVIEKTFNILLASTNSFPLTINIISGLNKNVIAENIDREKKCFIKKKLGYVLLETQMLENLL